MLGRGDQDDIDILVREQLFVVAVGFGAGTGGREPAFQIGLVDIADGGGPHGRVFLEMGHHAAAAAAGAD